MSEPPVPRIPSSFNLILTNPPFQDTVKRGKTPHKLWIDFTRAIFARYLAPGGLLCQVSPNSWCSPSNRILGLMKEEETLLVRHDTSRHFPQVGSTFSDYLIRKRPNRGVPARVVVEGSVSELRFADDLLYVPNDLVGRAIDIHRKVIFDRSRPRLRVEHDYVTCHNILLKRDGSLSKERTDRHVHPVFHTNRQTWWSVNRQEFASQPKVMWTRSGYTLPFFDAGVLGGTDMVYFVRVASRQAGEALAHNLNRTLFRYVFATARWSGFGNERVFSALPEVPADRPLSDEAMFDYFGISEEEQAHVRRTLGTDRGGDGESHVHGGG